MEFLPLLDGSRHALALGDGDGRFTAALTRRNRHIFVEAVDSSRTMLTLLRRRVERSGSFIRGDGELDAEEAECRVETHHQDALSYVAARRHGRRPDLVVTHFFLDCLQQSELDHLVGGVAALMSPGGIWVVSEFRVPKGRLRLAGALYIQLLYAAFRLLTGLQTTHLPDHERAFAAAGLTRIRCRRRFFGLLTSELWQAK